MGETGTDEAIVDPGKAVRFAKGRGQGMSAALRRRERK